MELQKKTTLREKQLLNFVVLDRLNAPLQNTIDHEFYTPLFLIMEMAQKIVSDSKVLGFDQEECPKKKGLLRGKINERANLILRNARDLLHLINQEDALKLAIVQERKTMNKGGEPSGQTPIGQTEGPQRNASKPETLASPTNRQEVRKKMPQSIASLSFDDNDNTDTHSPSNASKPPQQLNESDVFLEKVRAAIEENLTNPKLSVGFLSKLIGLSKSQLGRKLSAISGKSPLLLIRAVRLQKAIVLLKTTRLTISEIAYETGFSDPNYFTRLFVSETNQSPSTFRSQYQTI